MKSRTALEELGGVPGARGKRIDCAEMAVIRSWTEKTVESRIVNEWRRVSCVNVRVLVSEAVKSGACLCFICFDALHWWLDATGA